MYKNQMKQVLQKALNMIKAHIIQILQNSSNTIDANKVGKSILTKNMSEQFLSWIRAKHHYRTKPTHCITDVFESTHRKSKYYQKNWNNVVHVILSESSFCRSVDIWRQILDTKKPFRIVMNVIPIKEEYC